MDFKDVAIKFKVDGDVTWDAVIIDADPDVGFTIMDSDKKIYLTCYRGDSSPVCQKHPEIKNPELDKIVWEYLVWVVTGDRVFNNLYLISLLENSGGTSITPPSAAGCAFNM